MVGQLRALNHNETLQIQLSPCGPGGFNGGALIVKVMALRHTEEPSGVNLREHTVSVWTVTWAEPGVPGGTGSNLKLLREAGLKHNWLNWFYERRRGSWSWRRNLWTGCILFTVCTQKTTAWSQQKQQFLYLKINKALCMRQLCLFDAFDESDFHQ